MAKKRKEPKRGGQARATDRFTKLSHHKRQGGNLVPPLAALPGLKPSSWLHERLPDMLWCALLVVHLNREFALEILRGAAKAGAGKFEPGRDFDLSLTGLAELPRNLAKALIEFVCSAPGTRPILRALLLLDDLPARELWEAAIGEKPTPEDWEVLGRAVASTLDHQSQEATDCRWARVLFKVLSGQLKLRAIEQVRELLHYPYEGDQRKVRPFIRASEIADNPLSPKEARERWAETFWSQCLRDTSCEPMSRNEQAINVALGTTQGHLSIVRDALVQHAAGSLSTTNVDARHDATFGIAAYCLDILGELLRVGSGSSIVARAGLRTLLECYITFAYLAHRDDAEVWMAYRNYGAGQAKLAFLKVIESSDAPLFLSTEVLEMIANEDRWQEFVSINLGHWEKANLRSMSETAGVKEIYDHYYAWTSAFVHGNWAAVRNAEFDICANPLHRLHRVLRSRAAPLEDVVRDASRIVDLVLELIDRLYPEFTLRVSVADPGQTA